MPVTQGVTCVPPLDNKAHDGACLARMTHSQMILKPGMATMNKILTALFLIFGLNQGSLMMIQARAQPPNILLILADDLGFSDLGCYGGEIQTPNLDRLASTGVRFSQFYNTARCWPTRAALLTGHYAQSIRRDTVPGVRSGASGVRPAWAKLLPEYLQQAGYRSYHSGKWHLDGMPMASGFDRSYYLKDQGRFFYPKEHWLNDSPLPEVSRDADYYATTAIADHAIECLLNHAKHHVAQPFFQFVAFTAPHFPLQARAEDVQPYLDRYHNGWDQLRQERWQRQQELGLVPGPMSSVEEDIGPPYVFEKAMEILGPGEVNRPIPWERLTPEQRLFQADKMALHAAMVDRMDREIGRILQELERMQMRDQTLILFLSDNGASAEIMVRTDGHDPMARRGSGPSYLCLGPGWSTVCNTPFRRHKTWVHEGGIRTPLIMSWPSKLANPGRWVNQPGHVIDLLPTLLTLSGLEGSIQHLDPVPPGMDLLPSIVGDSPMRDRTEPLWWLHEGNRALRRGNWKLVAARDEPWELYDLSHDPQERMNLAIKRPTLVHEMAMDWQKLDQRFQDMARKP